VDGTVARLSEGIGALTLHLWLLGVPPVLADLNIVWIFWLLVVIILAWIALTYSLNRLGCSSSEPAEARIGLPDS
jgi:hypothetical protein